MSTVQCEGEDDIQNDDDDGVDDDPWRNTEHANEMEQGSVGNDDFDEDDSVLESLSDADGDDDNMITDLEHN